MHRNALILRNRLVVVVSETRVEISSIEPNVAESDVGTQAEILVVVSHNE
jgi:hypothetical protein